MQKMKRVVSTLLVIAMSLSLALPALAANQVPNTVRAGKAVTTEYSGQDLPVKANELGIDMVTDDGYHLEKIVVSVQATPSTDAAGEDAVEARFGEYISNVRLDNNDIYFPNNPIASNWYEGPMEAFSMTFEQSVEGKFSTSTGISASVINAGLDFSVTKSQKKTATMNFGSIPADKKLNVKEFGLYDAYKFDVYSMAGVYLGDGLAYKPMGLYIAQALYSK